MGGLRGMVAPRSLQNVAVPSYFMCPISLDMMRDPVTLSTGMTYDRTNIEKWLDDGNFTCPATMQILENFELIPNHTLRRLLQEWCVLNRSKGIERIPTPKVPAQPEQVKVMLLDISCGINVHETVKKVRSLAKESEKNRKCVVDCGAVLALFSLLSCKYLDSRGNETPDREQVECLEEVLATIALLAPMETAQSNVVAGCKELACISWFLRRGNLEAKINAAFVLEFVANNSDVKGYLGDLEGVTQGLVSLLKERYYPRAMKASLKCFIAICTHRKIKVKAVEAGAVSAIVEFLPEADPRVVLERALKVLEMLATCAEGREAISDHALAIPMLVKLILKASEVATEHCVVILWAVCMFSSNTNVQDAAVQAGAFTRLLLLLQTECTHRSKQKALELLKILRDIWNQYPCSPGKRAPSRISHF